MSALYEVYLRDENGKRGGIVSGIVSIETTFRRNQPAKWKITGAGLEECPVSEGASIAVFRNGSILFCGFLDQKEDKFDVATQIYDWEISGLSDLGRLSCRMIYPDPADETPDLDGSYSASGTLSSVLLDAVRLNAGSGALSARQIGILNLPEQTAVGESVTLESWFDELLKLVQTELSTTDFDLRESWDMATGKWSLRITAPEDVSDRVIFSVANGTISSWERTISAPKANFLIVSGCRNASDQLMSCIVYDADSISTWGRIEGLVSRSDIVRNEDESETWSSVAARLEAAAYEELEKATAQFGYKLTTTEISRNVYKEDYDIGSLVAVRIAGDEFTAKVEEIKVSYSGGVETIVPSVGTMQRGELQSVFTELGTLKEQIKVLQTRK